MLRLKRILLGLAAAIAGFVPVAWAQAPYPAKPIKIVVPYLPGGASDITARIFAQRLAPLLGQQFFIENKPGGGTNIAAESVARAAPDGYTLFLANFATNAINRWLYKSLPYDAATDFVPVAMLVRGPMFLCVRPGMNVNTVMELVQLAKDKPGALTYGSTGNGSPNHISGELLKYLAKIDAVHVPYKGSPEVVADLLAGQIDFGFDAAIIAQARAGKLKAIAVASNFRWPTDPTIPTIAESGFPDYDLSSFFGIVAPAKTATAIVEKLNEAFRTVALQPDLAEKLAVTATIPFPATLAETQAFLHDQSTRWASIVEASGAKVD